LAHHAPAPRSAPQIEGVSLGKEHPFIHVASEIESPLQVITVKG
jgi:hypothetical protein